MRKLLPLRRFRAALRDDGGIAMVEYALALPVLAAVSLYGMETANFVLANLRVSQMAAVTADNAGRVRDTIDETDVNELMIGAKLTGTSINFAENGRIILSDLEQRTDDTTKQWIRWQRCSGKLNVSSSYGTPTAMTASSMTAMGPTGNQIAAASGTAVMFVEVVYTYQPIVSNALLGPRTIRYTSAFNVRQRTAFPLTNTDGLGSGSISSCSTYSA